MTLAELNPSQRCTVLTASEQNPEIQSRLYALGIYPGVTVDILRLAPTGNPMQVRVGSTLLSIRKQEAESIEVELSVDSTLAGDIQSGK